MVPLAAGGARDGLTWEVGGKTRRRPPSRWVMLIPMTERAVRWTVRRATPDDASDLARINVMAWRRSYRGLLPDDFLDSMTQDTRVPGWERWLAVRGPGSVFVAVDRQGRVGAYCGVAPVRCERDARPGLLTAELVAMYTHPEVAGTGAGHAVHEAAVNYLHARGFEHVVSWVLAGNEEGVRFCERHGWRPEGVEAEAPIGGRTVTEVRYGRATRPSWLGDRNHPLSAAG